MCDRLLVASDGYFADYAGSGLTLDTADVITVTTAQGVQAALQLPNLTGQIDPVTDIVSGTAPPGTRLTSHRLLLRIAQRSTCSDTDTLYRHGAVVVVRLRRRTPSVVTATAQGDYLVNLHGILDLNNYSTGEVGLTTAEGHTVTRVLSLSRRESCDNQPTTISRGRQPGRFLAIAKTVRPNTPMALFDCATRLVT